MSIKDLVMAIKERRRNRFAANSLWLMAEQVYRLLLSFFISIYTARFLGPANMGLITYTSSFVATLMPIALLGMEYTVIKEVVNKPQEAEEIVGTGTVLRIFSGLACILFMIIAVLILNRGEQEVLFVAFLSSLTLMFSAFTLVDSWLQSQLRSKISTIIKSIAYTCMSAYKVYLLVAQKNVAWFAFATSLDLIIIAVLYSVFYFRMEKMRFRFSRTWARRLLKESYPLILANLMVVIYGQLDKVLLQQYHGNFQVGIYGVAANLSHMWQFVPAAIITSARPVILKLKEDNAALYSNRLRQLYAFIWWLSVLVGIVFLLVGSWLVVFMYGDAYRDSAGVLKILIWSQGFSLLGGARTIWFLAEEKTKHLIYCQMLSALVSVIINLALIPKLGGTGAAISMLITQFFIVILSTLPFKATRESSFMIVKSIFKFSWREK